MIHATVRYPESRVKRRRRVLYRLRRISCAAAAALALPSSAPAAKVWKPAHTTIYAISAWLGGAHDETACKTVEKRKLFDRSAVIENQWGGASRVALFPLNQKSGNSHYLWVKTRSQPTNCNTDQLPGTYHDYMSVALLFCECVTAFVRAELPIKDALDQVNRLKKDPAGVRIGVATLLDNHIRVASLKPLRAARVDISRVTVRCDESAQEPLTNMLGGHSDNTASRIPNVQAQMQGGHIWVLAVASSRRIDRPCCRGGEQRTSQPYELSREVLTNLGLATS